MGEGSIHGTIRYIKPSVSISSLRQPHHRSAKCWHSTWAAEVYSGWASSPCGFPLAPNKQLPRGAREGLPTASYSYEHVSPPWLNACFSFMAPSSLINIRNSLIMFFSLPNLCSLILSTCISTLFHRDLKSHFSKAFKHLIHDDFYQPWHGQFL